MCVPIGCVGWAYPVDCWDGDDDEEPVIYHGYTLTSKIIITGALTAINKYAFETSE